MCVLFVSNKKKDVSRQGRETLHGYFCCQHCTQHVCIGYILAVPTVFAIPSGHENRNFYYTLDILTGKISQRVSAEFDFFIENK